MNVKELYTEYRKAHTRHREKFGEPPYFQGYGDVYDKNIELIEKAIRNNKPVDEHSLPSLRNKKGIILID